MAETKIEEWKRKIAHKRRKQEEKEMMETYDALTNNYDKNTTFRARWTIEDTFDATSIHSQGMAADIAAEMDKEILKSLGVPEHLLGNKNGHDR